MASSRSLVLKELIEAGAPLERIVGKGPARPPVLSRCHQQERQVMLPSFFFLVLVILGEIIGVLLFCSTKAATGAAAVAARFCSLLL